MSEVICIENIQNYTLVYSNNTLILTPKEESNLIIPEEESNLIIPEQQILSENEIRELDLRRTTIIECVVKKKSSSTIISSNKTTYWGVLVDILQSIPKDKLKKTTRVKFMLTNECGTNEYYWYPKLGMSLQTMYIGQIMKELLYMLKINNYTINLSIKLQNSKIVVYTTH